ncbi:MAG: DUF4258 domain-containing protein [Myxococcales bacterium]|nr:DUF4258 domain-containing protein [Myxococcales bacterium]
MTEDEVREVVRTAAVQRRFRLSNHAKERCVARRVAYEDVRHALSTALRAHEQPNGCWRVTGRDLDDDDLTCIIAIEDDVVVVTLF